MDLAISYHSKHAAAAIKKIDDAVAEYRELEKVEQEKRDEIKAGDVVRLKSGGPCMVVSTIKENVALVTWFEEGDGIHECSTLLNTFEKARPPIPKPEPVIFENYLKKEFAALDSAFERALSEFKKPLVIRFDGPEGEKFTSFITDSYRSYHRRG